MNSYHHTTVSRRPVRSDPGQAEQIAEVVFEAEDPQAATTDILDDALVALGVAKADSSMQTEFGPIELCSLPFGHDADKPSWSNESVKVWLLSPASLR